LTAEIRIQEALATAASVARRLAVDAPLRRILAIIHRASAVRIGVVAAIAAVGRGGVEEVYCVPYLDVGCDVCFHVA
jgi:hypothetical protein